MERPSLFNSNIHVKEEKLSEDEDEGTNVDEEQRFLEGAIKVEYSIDTFETEKLANWTTIMEACKAYQKYRKSFPTKEDRKTLVHKPGNVVKGMGDKRAAAISRNNHVKSRALIKAAKRTLVQTGMTDISQSSKKSRRVEKNYKTLSNPAKKNDITENHKSDLDSSESLHSKYILLMEKNITLQEDNQALREENRRLKEEMTVLKSTLDLTKELPRLFFEVNALTQKVNSSRRTWISRHRISRHSSALSTNKENMLPTTPVSSFRTPKDGTPALRTSIVMEEPTKTQGVSTEHQEKTEATNSKSVIAETANTASADSSSQRLSDIFPKEAENDLRNSSLLETLGTDIISLDIPESDFKIKEREVSIVGGKTTKIIDIVDEKNRVSCSAEVNSSNIKRKNAFDTQTNNLVENLVSCSAAVAKRNVRQKNASELRAQLINGLKELAELTPEKNSKLIKTMSLQPEYNPESIFKFGCKTLTGKELNQCKHTGTVRVLASDLFRRLFSDEEMALGSLSGKASNAHKTFIPKSVLDKDRIQGIVDYIAIFLKGEADISVIQVEVKKAVTTKLNNFTKTDKAKQIQQDHMQSLAEAAQLQQQQEQHEEQQE